MTREQLPQIIEQSLRRLGGTAPLVEVAKDIWVHHEPELKASGNLFYTWQYEMRWAAQKLRESHKLAYSKKDRKQVWELI
jgi:hypothetical protein